MAGRIPSLNWLRVFEAAARSGSFARAAERLAMSPPAVSQQIRALEGHLGRPLFSRLPAGVALTETGRDLLAVVGEALGRMEAAASALAAPGKPPLVVGVSLMLSASWLAPRLPRFLEAHPGVGVDIQSLLGRPERPSPDADIWIAFGAPPSGVEAQHLFGETLIPVAAPAIADRIGSISDALRHPLIEATRHEANWMHVLGKDVDLTAVPRLRVDTTLLALEIAASGGGIALARAPASDVLVARLGLKPCLPDCETAGVEAYHILSPAGGPRRAEALAFQDWILAEAATLPQAPAPNQASARAPLSSQAD
ncbi:MAG: LysR family transcriptional regulator [Pseudomonadota bacterium]